MTYRNYVGSPAHHADETEVEAAIAAGDGQRAIGLLMRAYGTAVYTFCCRVLHDTTRAADVHIAVFEQAYRDLGRWERRSSLRSWLLGIANHRCLDSIKVTKREQARHADEERAVNIADPAADPALRLDAAARARALDSCLSALSAETRAVVLLRFQEGLSYEEIGHMLKEKPDSVRARVVRSFPRLRACLESKGIEP